MTWFCICGKEYSSVQKAEDCCGNYVVMNNDDESIVRNDLLE